MKHLSEGMLDEIRSTQYEGDKIISDTVLQLGVTANGFTFGSFISLCTCVVGDLLVNILC